MVMAMTIEKILADARLLVGRLRDHDTSADNLIAQTQSLHKRVDGMKQYEEDLNELNEIARHKPRAQLVLGIAQENSQIRELQHENKELRMSLEEHQSALELIMSKYRQQISRLVMVNKSGQNTPPAADGPDLQEKIDKICEMAAVMQRAVKMDEESCTEDQKMIAQLKIENKTLRELLHISTANENAVGASGVDCETQTGAYLSEEESDSFSSTSPNSSIIAAKPDSNSSFSRTGTIKKSPKTATAEAEEEVLSSSESESDTGTIKRAPKKQVNGTEPDTASNAK